MPVLPRNVSGGNEDRSTNRAPRPRPAWEVVVVAESKAGTFSFHSNSNEQPLPTQTSRKVKWEPQIRLHPVGKLDFKMWANRVIELGPLQGSDTNHFALKLGT